MKKPALTTDDHVEYILKNSAGKRPNGQAYASRTIKDAIKGTKKESRNSSL